MCGIGAYINFKKNENLSSLSKPILAGIEHRGPDGQGIYIDSEEKHLFVHALLKIMDQSDESNQPIIDEEGNVLIFNGSIYNYKDLVKKYQLPTHFNDSQCLFQLLKNHGEKILGEIEGMFALVYFDQPTKEYLVARDRFGEKPLFYGFQNGNIAIASLRRSLWNIGISKEVNVASLFNFLCYKKMGQLDELYHHTFSVPAGHFARFSKQTDQLAFEPIAFSKNFENLSFDELMNQSLSYTRIADYPIAHTLSGGIDSGGLLSYSVNHGTTEAYSFGSPGFEHDESQASQSIADFIGLKRLQFVGFPNDLDKILTDFEVLSQIHEEPLVAPNSLAHYYLCHEIERNHRVMIEGQGSDELFCGYPIFFSGLLFDKIPSLSYLFTKALPIEKLQLRKTLLYQLSKSLYQKLYRNKGRKIAKSLSIPKSLWSDFEQTIEDEVMLADSKGVKSSMNYVTHNGFFKNLLRVCDRNSMYCHLETRLPYLNSKLVALANQLNPKDYWKDGYYKYYLRKQFVGKLPNDIIWNKQKNGFSAPIKTIVQSERFQDLLRNAHQYFIENGWVESHSNWDNIKQDEELLWKLVAVYLATK